MSKDKRVESDIRSWEVAGQVIAKMEKIKTNEVEAAHRATDNSTLRFGPALKCGSSECVKHDRCSDCPVNMDAQERAKRKDPTQAMLHELVAYCNRCTEHVIPGSASLTTLAGKESYLSLIHI